MDATSDSGIPRARAVSIARSTMPLPIGLDHAVTGPRAWVGEAGKEFGLIERVDRVGVTILHESTDLGGRTDGPRPEGKRGIRCEPGHEVGDLRVGIPTVVD